MYRKAQLQPLQVKKKKMTGSAESQESEREPLRSSLIELSDSEPEAEEVCDGARLCTELIEPQEGDQLPEAKEAKDEGSRAPEAKEEAKEANVREAKECLQQSGYVLCIIGRRRRGKTDMCFAAPSSLSLRMLCYHTR
jgi:hypothetical protein